MTEIILQNFDEYIKEANPANWAAGQINNQVILEFPNGWRASVVQGFGSYGADQGLFELAVLRNDHLHYNNPVAQGDVRGYLTPAEVRSLLAEIMSWPNKEF